MYIVTLIRDVRKIHQGSTSLQSFWISHACIKLISKQAALANLIMFNVLQEEQRELAKTIRVSGSILLSTVSNFLDFFKMEAGKQLDVVRTEMTIKVTAAACSWHNPVCRSSCNSFTTSPGCMHAIEIQQEIACPFMTLPYLLPPGLVILTPSNPVLDLSCWLYMSHLASSGSG